MHDLSPAAMEVLVQAAQEGQEAARRLLADLGGPPEDLHVPACIREARLQRPFFLDID